MKPHDFIATREYGDLQGWKFHAFFLGKYYNVQRGVKIKNLIVTSLYISHSNNQMTSYTTIIVFPSKRNNSYFNPFRSIKTHCNLAFTFGNAAVGSIQKILYKSLFFCVICEWNVDKKWSKNRFFALIALRLSFFVGSWGEEGYNSYLVLFFIFLKWTYNFKVKFILKAISWWGQQQKMSATIGLDGWPIFLTISW